MNIITILPRLRARGVVLAAKGSNLTIQRGSALISHDERAWLRANRSAVIAAVLTRAKGDPTLATLLKRWHAMVRVSNPDFLRALHRVTGCDLEERNPTAEEIRVFDAILAELAAEMLSLAQSKFALKAREEAASARPGRGMKAQEATA